VKAGQAATSRDWLNAMAGDFFVPTAAITSMGDRAVSFGFQFPSTALKPGLLRHLAKLAEIPANELD
jgi:hypothetical protein